MLFKSVEEEDEVKVKLARAEELTQTTRCWRASFSQMKTTTTNACDFTTADGEMQSSVLPFFTAGKVIKTKCLRLCETSVLLTQYLFVHSNNLSEKLTGVVCQRSLSQWRAGLKGKLLLYFFNFNYMVSYWFMGVLLLKTI